MKPIRLSLHNVPKENAASDFSHSLQLSARTESSTGTQQNCVPTSDTEERDRDLKIQWRTTAAG